ncbi:hypothetical protein [Gemmatimonas groenlandica]|uniref:RagB/SusD domain-containing protein n=1 Tax=Gemmatimonas groenlandica TaxID=2732249 RepID=A0A6M4IM88_9BACT|nr:hypothetical protein [Gemmatimonas groenlandica]QJR34526.1 hypothetical protein HKW67_02815 [Gemmatimonas groenlandica]
MAAAFAVAGCSSDLLSVPTPDVIAEGAIGGSLGVTTLRNGSMQDFIVSYSGTQDGFVVVSGNLGDELNTTDTFADRYNTDGRNSNEVLGGAVNTTYNQLQLARAGLAAAIEKWIVVKPTTAAVKDSLSEMYAIRGFAETAFGEGYCSGVPFSKVSASGDFEYGDPLTTAQVYTRALASMDTALTNATGVNYRSLAQIGKARVLLDQGQFAAAAAAVSGVLTTYKYVLSHSIATGRQTNGLWTAMYNAGTRYTVTTNEGINGIDYLVTPADPRVPWVPTLNLGFDGTSTNLPRQQKYTSQSAPFTLADGIEARLIEAEARLQGATQGDRDAVFAQLNTLRATGLSTAIAPLAASPTTQAAAVDMLFKERAYWLYLTGHRLGDMRRLIRQYQRTAATVFPTGPMRYRPGNNYGTDVTLIVPFIERNNPKFTGCLDRNP